MFNLPRLLALCLAGIVLLGIVACGDDDGPSPDQTPSPTASGPPDLSPRVGGVEAASRYLQETGIDGDEGDITEPQDCAQVTDDSEGEFCVHESFSTYAQGLVILRVARSDDPNGDVWEMRLLLTDRQWQVQSVEPFGDTQ